MAQTFTLALALLAVCTGSLGLAAHPQQLPHQQVTFQNNNITIRPATELDLDDITTVIIDAFAPGPLYQYVFPRLDHFKKRLWECSREQVGLGFANRTDHDFVNVISVPVSDADTVHGDRRERVVSVAIWNFMEPPENPMDVRRATSLGSHFTRHHCEKHVGLNMTRAANFSRQFDEAEKEYIEDYPGKQVYLAVLATHPDWDGHGFGAAQCRWGIEMATAWGVRTTLIGTPAGWPLYDSLGFKSVANITIETLDDFDDLWFEFMRYNPWSDLP